MITAQLTESGVTLSKDRGWKEQCDVDSTPTSGSMWMSTEGTAPLLLTYRPAFRCAYEGVYIENTMNTTENTTASSPIQDLIQRGKSAEGRLRKVSGDGFSVLDWRVSVSGKGDARRISGASAKGRRYAADALASLSVGDAESLPAYQAMIQLSQYLEISPSDLTVSPAS